MSYKFNIEYFIKLKKFTKKSLMEKSGVSQTAFFNAMNNDAFTTNMLEKLAKALNVTVADLVKDRSIDEKQEALKDISEIKKRLDDFEQKHLK